MSSHAFRDQRGITRLELTIIMIAFMVVISLFNLAVLAPRYLSDPSRPVVARDVVSESSATLILIGEVVGDSNPTHTALDSVTLTLTSGGRVFKPADLSSDATIITYLDDQQAVNVPASQWSATWLIGDGPRLEPGEAVEVRVTLANLSLPLEARREFAIRVYPIKSSVLMVNRTAPLVLARRVVLE